MGRAEGSKVQSQKRAENGSVPVTGRDTAGGPPAVAVPAIHYGHAADRQRYDILQSIRTLTLLSEQRADKRMGGRFHFRSAVEMAAACKEHPEWLHYSLEIAERCTSICRSASRSFLCLFLLTVYRQRNSSINWCCAASTSVTGHVRTGAVVKTLLNPPPAPCHAKERA